MTGFTVRECGVAACLLDGLRDKATARATGLSIGMVGKTVAQLRARFRVTSRVALALELARFA